MAAVVGEARIDLDRDAAIDAVRGLEDRAQHVTRGRHAAAVSIRSASPGCPPRTATSSIWSL
jgi:hypothetical protein